MNSSTAICINVNLWGGKSRLYSLEQNGWTVAAMSGVKRNGLRTLYKHREPPASGARVADMKPEERR